MLSPLGKPPTLPTDRTSKCAAAMVLLGNLLLTGWPHLALHVDSTGGSPVWELKMAEPNTSRARTGSPLPLLPI